MSIKFVKGDIFATPGIDVIAHGVNLKGAFGAGIAGEIAKRFPWAKEDYLKWVHYRSHTDLGNHWVSINPDIDEDEEGIHHIIHMATQYYPGPDARITAIGRALRALKNVYQYPDQITLALPQVGCGIGGLHWRDVKPMMENIFKDHPLNVVVFEQYIPGKPAVLTEEDTELQNS